MFCRACCFCAAHGSPLSDQIAAPLDKRRKAFHGKIRKVGVNKILCTAANVQHHWSVVGHCAWLQRCAPRRLQYPQTLDGVLFANNTIPIASCNALFFLVLSARHARVGSLLECWILASYGTSGTELTPEGLSKLSVYRVAVCRVPDALFVSMGNRRPSPNPLAFDRLALGRLFRASAFYFVLSFSFLGILFSRRWVAAF